MSGTVELRMKEGTVDDQLGRRRKRHISLHREMVVLQV